MFSQGWPKLFWNTVSKGFAIVSDIFSTANLVWPTQQKGFVVVTFPNEFVGHVIKALASVMQNSDGFSNTQSFKLIY